MQQPQRLQLHPIELAVSNAVCLRDPNSSEATVGISELVRVCVLRCDVLELFWVGVQDEQALNYLWISVPGMESCFWLTFESLSGDWVLVLFFLIEHPVVTA